ncbi:protein ZNRD2-like [Ostrea edulis]|uniref:protein ZNRD2-like n=1 Tax=Ostrea edulis TaxID=37623 RepID=UPI00209424FF|nr:protein ZNRD2-like [Ostrea edulis]
MDLEWHPPSEAEMKILEARRERSDRISKLMGDYLLKGYKMLGSVCQICDTILLEDREGVNYCIACSELDTDTDKDDPVVSSTAAKSLTEERQIPTQIRYAAESSGRNQIAHVSQSVPHSKKSRPDLYETSSQNPVKSTGGSESLEPWQSSAVNSLCEKIQWASEELKHSNSVDYSIQLCQLIKGSADALQSLKSLQ